MTRTIIQTENMGYSYPDGTSALNDINIEIKEGGESSHSWFQRCR